MSGKRLMNVKLLNAMAVLSIFLVFSSCKARTAESVYTEARSEQSNDISGRDITSSRQNAITRAVDLCSPAIVGINVTEVREVVYRDPFSDMFDDPFFGRFFGQNRGSRTQKYQVQGLGSGFIISSDGYILTNHHVAGNASKVVVTMTNGEKYNAELVGSDMASDVALLKIDCKNLPFLKLANSDNVIVGEWAIAFGNPFGLFDINAKPTVTVGVVSNKNINFVQEDRPYTRIYRGMIQTDAAISSGNSGGPLVNSLGDVIGMNTVIFSTSQNSQGAGSIGIGFAIPINRVKKVVDQLKNHKNIDRNFSIGWEVREIDEQLARYLKLDSKREGVVVFSIERNSPAESAGLQPGDIITEINGSLIRRDTDFNIIVGDAVVGDVLNLVILRDGKSIKKDLLLKSNKR